MSEGGQNKRKSKKWYKKQAYHNKRRKTDTMQPGHKLMPGLKGFIVTCNDWEKDAVKEAYNILNEYADKLYGPENKAEADSSGGESDGGDDVEAAVAKEVQSLKDATAKGERRFQNSQSGAKNCIFIKTTVADPVGLAHTIFTDLHESRKQKCRHALRLLPVVGTCKANVKDIGELAKEVLQPFFTETKLEVTVSISFKARNNGGIGREMVMATLKDTITETFPSTLIRFTYTNPDIMVLVEVICGTACIAVAKDFFLFRKYNLVEVVRDKPEPTETDKTEKPEVVQPQDSSSTDQQEGTDDTKETPLKDSANGDQKETSEQEGTEDLEVAQIEDSACVDQSDIPLVGKESINQEMSNSTCKAPAKAESADKIPDSDLSSGQVCETLSTSGVQEAS